MLTSQAPLFRYCFVFLVAAVFLVGFFVAPNFTSAANKYWVGNDGVWATASNWKTTDLAGCGSGDAGAAPGVNDVVFLEKYVIKTPISSGWKEIPQGSDIVGFEDKLFSLQR